MSTLDPCLAVVPARGGSKGLPRKNVRVLAGLPLIAHSLRCAALTPRIARTIVSTDDREIAAVATEHGGDVPFMRPATLAQDDTPMMPVVRHALREMEQLEQRHYGSVLLLDPTSPARIPEDISRAFGLLDQADADGVVACSEPSFNPFWVAVVERDGVMTPAFASPTDFLRRQTVPRCLRINGALYLWRSEFVRTAPDNWRDGRHLVLEIPESRAMSIDDLHGFRLAEALITSGLASLPWLGATT